uniref:AtpZ/AtpI family protein n=1 Tax=Sphingomonas sp. TaxID=28214 RepID=UPI0025D64933|nr:AtpZ/AtpI family protein [Sphingomonas sp.]
MAEYRPNDDLNSRIAKARASEQARAEGGGPGKPAKGYSQGSRVLATLLGALFGGGVMGWAIDQFFGTSPWALLIVLTLAVIGAFMNIIKMSKERAE